MGPLLPLPDNHSRCPKKSLLIGDNGAALEVGCPPKSIERSFSFRALVLSCFVDFELGSFGKV
jgi:hypothetical protein